MADRILRIGVLGLSRGFVLMRPTFVADDRCRLVAAADPRPEARAAFQAEFGAPAYETAQALCADPQVEVVYIASPHQFHAEQAILAARHGKPVLVEKPMALSLAECDAMQAATRDAGVQLIVGPSHSYDPPIACAADLIASGAHGALRMIVMMTFTDFLYRPRRPEELDTARGGGVVFSQAAHQVDVVRRLAGRPIRSVRAQTGAWDPDRPTEGAYQAFLTFEGGATATLSYSGYGRYDTDALMDWIGETGMAKDPGLYGAARLRLAGAQEEALKRQRAYGGQAAAPPAGSPHHEHFGQVIASCERADLRPTATGVEVYADERRTIDLPPRAAPRAAVIDELWRAIVPGAPPLHDAAWGRDNLAACLAMLRSSAEGREVSLSELESPP
ncbi:Gfo/Idh/MocA family oxidoreductase [Phenylobacterium sp.]|uniref:Gfo/Idh/MocA family protein n=1 Tax=Phenylobacterium sp. TaxID=1871053 RepID=UPI0025FA6F6A|nr:Gfo/Idh/MocA family oxidoreductase [Phenylobacterium sp.]